jgi:hypothetical protein
LRISLLLVVLLFLASWGGSVDASRLRLTEASTNDLLVDVLMQVEEETGVDLLAEADEHIRHGTNEVELDEAELDEEDSGVSSTSDTRSDRKRRW